MAPRQPWRQLLLCHRLQLLIYSTQRFNSPSKTCCFLTLDPCVFNPCAQMIVVAGQERLHLPVWRRESLLRILALLHHNTHDVSTFHTHFPQQLLKAFGRPCPQTRARPSRDTGTRPLGAPETALGCDQSPLQSPFRGFRCHLI